MLADRVNARADALRSADPITLEEFGALMGQSNGTRATAKSGSTVSAKSALGLSAWYSGVRHISEVMAGLPCHRFRDSMDGRERRAKPQWMRQPDVEQTWYGLVEFWLMSLLHRGNAYSFKLRNAADQVSGLREIHPDRVTVGQAPDGTKRFLVDDIEVPYSTRDVFHIPGLAYNGRVGMNPIQTFADGLGNVMAAEEYASRFFSNGTNLGGIISVEGAVNQTELKELKREWEDFHQGLLNSHRTGVLSRGSTYQRLALDAEDTQLLQTRQFGVVEVARMLRLPPHKLYDLTNATYSNIEHQSIEATTDGIQPWCERIEAWLNADRDLTPAGTFVEFDLEGRLRGDTKTRYEAYTSAVGGPWAAMNEIRRLENMPPVDGGDTVLRPLNMGDTTQDFPSDGNPDAPPDDTTESRELAEIVQKVYLGVVNKVITPREARQLLIKAGADIPPDFPGGDQ